jgi:hypothetical protein
MNEGLNVDKLLKRIDQLLNVLNMITKDLREVSNALKAVGVPSTSQEEMEVGGSLQRVSLLFPDNLRDLLDFEEKEEYIVIKPRRYLGSDNFAKIASIVRDAGGEYISAGKESHFRVSKE